MSNHKDTIFTIGHSNYEIDKFLGLLKQHCIEVVADVRSSPYSQYSPQFNKDILKKALNNHNIKYLFLGAELGARPDDPACYIYGRVSFDKLRKSAAFQQGIERLLIGIKDCTIAIMCSEKEPADCHRTVLVSRVLAESGVSVQHILESGDTMDQTEIENQLMKKFKFEPDFFTGKEVLIQDAYKKQEEKISYNPHTEGANAYE
mgnify:CR=1 FL=1